MIRFQGVIKKFSPINLILIFFGIIYCSISLVNHFNFRTYAFDLGLFNNALFDFAHFRPNDYGLIKERFSNPLADHFSLVTPIISPLYWIFGSYTMLVFQVAMVLIGGFGVYRYFKNKNNSSPWIPELAALHFFSMWGIYSALAFDYHDNVIAACIVPWFVLFFEQKKTLPAWLTFFAILITKENMAFWAIFISLGLAIIHYKDKKLLINGLVFFAMASVYFVLIVKVVMPGLGTLNPAKGYHHFAFKALGSTPAEAINTIITRPFYFIKLFFVNHFENFPEANGIKKEMYITLLLSGGFALLLKPRYLVMLIPIFGQKMLNDYIERWGLNYHYSIELVPVVSIVLFIWISEMKSYTRIIILAISVCVSTIVTTFHKLEHRVSLWYEPLNAKFYSPWHYRSEFNRQELTKAMDLIPAEARVSASSPLVPHLAFRDVIYLFPMVDDADYIVLVKALNPYPLSPEAFAEKVNEYRTDPGWEVLFDQSDIYIFHKKSAGTENYTREVLAEENFGAGDSSGAKQDGLSIADMEYGPTLKIDDIELNARIPGRFISNVVISINEMEIVPPNSLFFVTSVETADKRSISYKSIDIATLAPDSGKYELSLTTICTSPVEPGTVLLTYVWNKGALPVRIMKMSLVYEIGNVADSVTK